MLKFWSSRPEIFNLRPYWTLLWFRPFRDEYSQINLAFSLLFSKFPCIKNNFHANKLLIINKQRFLNETWKQTRFFCNILRKLEVMTCAESHGSFFLGKRVYESWHQIRPLHPTFYWRYYFAFNGKMSPEAR